MKVLDILKEVMRESIPQDADDIVPSTRLIEDLGFDSLDRIEVAMGIEERFECGDIGPDAADKWITVGDMVEWVEKNIPADKVKAAAKAKGAGTD
jgi:acyl carrier protein